MNSKMTTNSQLSANEPKKIKERTIMKTKTKQTTRTGTESEKWISHGEISVGRGRGRMVGKVQGIRSIIGRHKIDGERLRIVRKQRSQRTYMYNPWT